jgi:excisionase family DNA binding protein
MYQQMVLITPSELQTLITDAVNVAVQQFTLPQKIDPLPVTSFMSIEQAGQYLNLAKQTLYGYVSSRTIPFIKKGKKLYFVKTEIDKWLAEGSKYTRNQIIQNLKPNN